MKQLIFNNQQKIQKKKERKGKKRKGGKGKGNEKGKRILVLLKDFWQKIETMYISKKKLQLLLLKNKQRKNLKQLYIVTWQCFNPRVLR